MSYFKSDTAHHWLKLKAKRVRYKSRKAVPAREHIAITVSGPAIYHVWGNPAVRQWIDCFL